MKPEVLGPALITSSEVVNTLYCFIFQIGLLYLFIILFCLPMIVIFDTFGYCRFHFEKKQILKTWQNTFEKKTTFFSHDKIIQHVMWHEADMTPVLPDMLQWTVYNFSDTIYETAERWLVFSKSEITKNNAIR